MKKLLVFLVFSFQLLALTQTVQAQGSSLAATISSSSNVLCANANTGSATVTASYGVLPYTYSWAPTGGTDVTISNLNAGVYTITVTDAVSDVATASVTITQPSPLNISPSYQNNVTCRGYNDGSAGVNANGGVSPYIYSWAPGGNTNTTESGLSGGTYTVTATDANSCTANCFIPIGLQSDPSATISQVNEPSCFGNANGSSTGAVSGGIAPYTYLWLPGGATSPTATNLSAGTYTMQVHDALGCSTSTTSTVLQPNPLQLTLHYIDSIGYAIASGGTAPYTYKWYPNLSTNAMATGLRPGTYTVTVNDANLCSDSIVSFFHPDTLISFTFSTPTIECGDPGYVNFTIMVSSYYRVNFSNCELSFYYKGGEFAGDNYYNGGVIITPDDSFAYDPPKNDYVNNTIQLYTDSVIRIQIGVPNDVAPEGTVIDNTPRDFIHVKLRIQNSCQPGYIYFDSTDAYDAQFTKVDSSFSDTVSIRTYSLSNQHNCPVYREPQDTCNYHCIAWDIDNPDSCIAYAWDSCGTIIGYFNCWDTTWYSKVDSIYDIHSYTYRSFQTIGFYNQVVTTPACLPTITDQTNWHHPINAGTNKESIAWIASIPENSSILTINGYGFGGTKGTVKVRDANSYGTAYLDSSDIWNWSENYIKIKMPSVLFNNANATPGSGPFTIYDACGDSVSNYVQINYSIINGTGGTPLEKVRLDIVMQNDSESLIFHCDTSISNHPQAYACVKKAIREWNCFTGINWRLGNSDTLEATAQDGISEIYFSSSTFSPSGRLMETQPWPLNSGSPPGFDPTDSVAFYDEADIKIKRDQYVYLYTGKHWSYDTTGIPTASDSNYFYDFILHELGHAHGLEHINDSVSLMFWILHSYQRYSIISGSAFPGPAPLLGALDEVKTSLNYPACCSYTTLITDTRTCIDPYLYIPDIPINTHNLNLFPNPVDQGNITIAYQLTKNSYIQFKILDCIGRVVLTLSNENKPPGIYSEQININSLARGIYLFTANINGVFQTIKFIKI